MIRSDRSTHVLPGLIQALDWLSQTMPQPRLAPAPAPIPLRAHPQPRRKLTAIAAPRSSRPRNA